mmetsp:Transcript_22890/g.36751  ORF Transcript_22890/g.36751 Transcript_22890/m.36751 type:complete len:449 (+) Transcript_22890:30-1376(+)
MAEYKQTVESDNEEEEQSMIAGQPRNKTAEDAKTQEVTDDMFIAEGVPREIGSMVFVFRVSDVNLVAQTFFADFGLEFQWQCTKNEYERFCADPANYVPDVAPTQGDLVFLNGDIADIQLTTKHGNQGFHIATVGSKGNFGETFGDKIRCPVMNLCYYVVKGTFTESFELQSFPFDVQDLQISIKLMSDVSRAILTPTQIQFKGDYAGYVLLKYSPLGEYKVHTPILEYDLLKTFVTQSSLNVRMKVERKYENYIWKIYLTAFITTASTLFCWSMDPVDDLSDRLGFVVTLLLTAVAFQFVVSTELPKLPYLTLLDEYIVLSFVFLFLVMIMIGVAPLAGDSATYDGEDDHPIAVADRVCLAIAVVVLVGYHVVVVVRILMKRRAEIQKVDLDKWSLEEWEKKNVDPDDVEVERVTFSISDSIRITHKLWEYVDANKYRDCERSMRTT